MTLMDPGLIEKYQQILQKDPKSKVFAPLAEAYRIMGLRKEAKQTCEDGLGYHPTFAGGYVALAKILMDEKQIQSAIPTLKKATEYAPENLLAYQLLADCHLQLKQAKEALKAFKMVLFLSPNDEKALRAVKKLESLTADEYEEELFEMKKLGSAGKTINNTQAPEIQPVKLESASADLHLFLERHLSLADAFTVRGDLEKAFSTLKTAEEEYGPHNEIRKRISKILDLRSEPSLGNSPSEPQTDAPTPKDGQIEFLQKILERLKTYPKP